MLKCKSIDFSAHCYSQHTQHWSTESNSEFALKLNFQSIKIKHFEKCHFYRVHNVRAVFTPDPRCDGAPAVNTHSDSLSDSYCKSDKSVGVIFGRWSAYTCRTDVSETWGDPYSTPQRFLYNGVRSRKRSLRRTKWESVGFFFFLYINGTFYRRLSEGHREF